MATKKLLTEQEVLAMSDKDYMNDKMLEFFKHRLSVMEKELQHNADKTTENLRATTVVPLPTVPRSKRSTRWNSERVTVNGSC